MAILSLFAGPAEGKGWWREPLLNARAPPEVPCSTEARVKRTEHHPELGLLQWCRLRRQTVPAPALQLLFRRLRFAHQADDRRSQREQPCKALASSETLRRMRKQFGLT